AVSPFRSTPTERRCAAQRAARPRPTGSTELAERLAQVVLDGARADEQLSRDFAIRVSFRRQARDLRLMRRQLVERVDRPLPGMLAGRLQLDARPFRERLHPE